MCVCIVCMRYSSMYVEVCVYLYVLHMFVCMYAYVCVHVYERTVCIHICTEWARTRCLPGPSMYAVYIY